MTPAGGPAKPYESIVAHYEACFERHGDTHQGVDWPNPNDVITRHSVMLDMLPEGTSPVSLLDFGCGAAHLLDTLVAEGWRHVQYAGLDLSPKFVDFCRTKHPGRSFFCADLLEAPGDVPEFDYIVCNGVFTEKQSLSQSAMWDYTQRLLKVLYGKARHGLAFNVMSSDVDWERDDLFHLPMDTLTAFLSRSLSRNVVLRADYGLYEYTAYVYREPRTRR